MAPLPKRRHSTRRGGQRTASRKIYLSNPVKCPQCGKMKLPHRACLFCGYYKGREVLKFKPKVTAK